MVRRVPNVREALAGTALSQVWLVAVSAVKEPLSGFTSCLYILICGTSQLNAVSSVHLAPVPIAGPPLARKFCVTVEQLAALGLALLGRVVTGAVEVLSPEAT